MRSLAELGELRGSLRSTTAWPLLLTLHREAEDAGAPFRRTIFDLGWSADLPYARIRALLDELVDADAIAYQTVNGDVRTVEIVLQ